METYGIAFALDSIVLADPQYFWRTDDGVLNLLPKTGEPQLLHVLISEFSIDDATSATASLSQLLSRPEITTAMTDLKLDWGLQVGIPVVTEPEEVQRAL